MAAARALSQKARSRNALSIAANSVRVALAAAALCADRSASPTTVSSREDDLHRLDTIQRALRNLWTVRDPWPWTGFFLRRKYRLSWKRSDRWLAGGDTSPTAPSAAPMSPPRPSVQPFQQRVHLFLAAVTQGMPAIEALRLFAQ